MSSLVPHLVARDDEDEGLGEAVIAAIELAIVACCIPLAILLLRLSRKSRLYNRKSVKRCWQWSLNLTVSPLV
jgi:hypothetical protein